METIFEQLMNSAITETRRVATNVKSASVTAAHKSFSNPQYVPFLVVIVSERITSSVTTGIISDVSLIASPIEVLYVVAPMVKVQFASPFVEME